MSLQGLLQYNLTDTLDFYHFERVAEFDKKTFVREDYFRMQAVGKYRRVSSAFAGAKAGGYVRGAVPKYYGAARAGLSGWGRRLTPYSRGRRRQYPARVAVLGVETKFFDTAKVATAVAAVAALTGGEYDPALPAGANCISTPPIGDTEQSRDGKKIVIKNVQIKGHVARDPGENQIDPAPSTKVFVALVLDTQSNGAALNSEDVYKNLTAEVTSAVEPTRNLLFANRFRILKTQLFDMDVPTLAIEGDNLHSWNGQQQCFEWYVDTKDLLVNFNAGTTSDIANVIDNSLHVIAFATVTNCTLAYNARIRFQG